MKTFILFVVLFIIYLAIINVPAKRLAQFMEQRRYNRMREMEELNEIVRKKQEANYYRMKQQKAQHRTQNRR